MRFERLRQSRIMYGMTAAAAALVIAGCGGGGDDESKTEKTAKPQLTLKQKTGRAYGELLASDVVYCEGKRTEKELDELTQKIGEYGTLRTQLRSDLIDEDTLVKLNESETEFYIQNIDEGLPPVDASDELNCVNFNPSPVATASANK
ncbi:MAG TPA: hypothetical protein VFW77_05265 [Candidatus Saccharimonadales bacterium]|nr:hypothetical protein [Candidatus Saccharimonadales bacterium]